MAINIIIEPHKVYENWEDFRQQKPPFSIALDGIVNDITRREYTREPYANFDHHANVDRLATRSTCGQVQMEICTGLLSRIFVKDGVPTATGYINKPDEDACTATWLLIHHEKVEKEKNRALKDLIEAEDKLDATGGMYPLNDLEMLKKMAWVFAPYCHVRFERILGRMSAQEQKENVLDEVHKRITKHVTHGGGELELEGQYEILGGGANWVMVKEIGISARYAMFGNGIRAYVTFRGEYPSGRYHYAFGRAPGENFPIPYFYDCLNAIETGIVTGKNFWGGGDNHGGSPQETGSLFPPKRLIEFLNQSMALR